MTTESLDERYLKGIELFNKREFFDAHEIWEELWHEQHGEHADFVQGLIQFATCLHHFEAQNLKGTQILYQGGEELLSPYPDVYWGCELKKLRNDMQNCVKDVMKFSYAELPGRYDPKKHDFSVKIQTNQIPTIKLQN